MSDAVWKSQAEQGRYLWRVFTALIKPIMALNLIIGYWTNPKDGAHPTDTMVDWVGAGVVTAAQIFVTLPLTFSVTQGRGWTAPCKPLAGYH